MWEILLRIFLLFIVVQTMLIGGLVLYGQSRLNRIETNQLYAPISRPTQINNQDQANTNDGTQPTAAYNSRIGSHENEPVRTKGAPNNQAQGATLNNNERPQQQRNVNQ